MSKISKAGSSSISKPFILKNFTYQKHVSVQFKKSHSNIAWSRTEAEKEHSIYALYIFPFTTLPEKDHFIFVC